MIDYCPQDLGLPPRYESFRDTQSEAIEYALYDSQKRFTALGLPTGSGKTAAAIAISKLMGVKAVYLTATRGLEDQVSGEFDIVDVRGKANYGCQSDYGGKHRSRSCEYGIDNGCLYGSIKSPSCTYHGVVSRAEQSSLISTNYSYWLHARSYNASALEGDGDPVGLLICDEAHSIPNEISRFMEVNLPRDEHHDGLYVAVGYSDHVGTAWTDWAREERRVVMDRMKRYESDDDRYKELDIRKRRLSDILLMDSSWVYECGKDVTTFSSIYPARYAHYLWSAVPRVLLLSGTLRPYALSLTGLSPDDYDFREWPSSFPAQNAPLYYMPTASLSRASSEEDYAKVISAMDEILDGRSDRRAIVHTGSYERANRVLGGSRHRAHMVSNRSGNGTGDALREFRRRQPPVILVSPSVTTGYDFKADECRLQIILKVPFPNEGSRVVKERCKSNEYRLYSTIQELVQIKGRAVREPDDWAETFILDSKFAYVASQGGKYAPGGRLQYFQVAKVPPPLRKI